MSPEALASWPARGTGALPDGYMGSGKVWHRVAQKYKADLTWRILSRVDGSREEVDALERRAVRLARAVFGRQCLNIRDGGQGMSSRDGKLLWADPDYAARTGAAIKAAHARPEVRARRSEANNRPDVRAKLSAAHKAMAQTEERREQLSRATEASLTPEARAKRNTGQSSEAREKRRVALRAIAATPEGFATLTRARAAGCEPDVQARRVRTRMANDGWRTLAAERPALFS